VGPRRKGRELALRALFQIDVAEMKPEEAFAAAASPGGESEEASAFAHQLVEGALSRRQEIDAAIERHAIGWTIGRMAGVDRNLLRIAMYEILHLPDIPPSVSVDEAVELAKRYSTAESGRFVNGILGSALRELTREQPRDEGE